IRINNNVRSCDLVTTQSDFPACVLHGSTASTQSASIELVRSVFRAYFRCTCRAYTVPKIRHVVQARPVPLPRKAQAPFQLFCTSISAAYLRSLGVLLID